MTKSSNDVDKIEMAQAHALLQGMMSRRENVKLYFNQTEFHALKILRVDAKNFELSFLQPSNNPFLIGQSYILQFENGGSTYSGEAVVDKVDKTLILHYSGSIRELNRRGDFRIHPPDKIHYSLQVLRLNGVPIQQKFEIFDVSMGGAKLLIPGAMDVQPFKVGGLLEGHFKFHLQNIDFKGTIKSINKKHLSIQFSDLGEAGKNLLWHEIMNWCRLRKNTYVD